VSTCYIIDTNVVVAGLLSAQADSPVVRILDAMLGAAFSFALSPDLLFEYRAVLLRPRLVKRHGLTAEQIDTVLTDLAGLAIVLKPPAKGSLTPAPDPGDQFLWDLLALRTDLILVTGDQRLLEEAAMRHRVIAPTVLAERLWH